MKFKISQKYLKKDFNVIQTFTIGFIFSFLLTLIYKSFFIEFTVFGFLFIVLSFLFSRMFYKTISNLFYTFWTFLAFYYLTLFYILYNAVFIYENNLLFNLATFSFLILCILTYALSSPYYFPVVRWWEYDFRYRTDISIDLTYESERYDARLTDIRRGAGCINAFHSFSVGDNCQIEIPAFSNYQFNLRILSQRLYSIGRPYTYGCRFIIESDSDRKKLIELQKYWTQSKNKKTELKFKNYDK